MIPYELIGKVVVLLFVLGFISVLSVGLYAVWYRGLTYISNYLWRDVEWSDGETPSLWKHYLSHFLIRIRNGEISKAIHTRQNVKEVREKR